MPPRRAASVPKSVSLAAKPRSRKNANKSLTEAPAVRDQPPAGVESPHLINGAVQIEIESPHIISGAVQTDGVESPHMVSGAVQIEIELPHMDSGAVHAVTPHSATGKVARHQQSRRRGSHVGIRARARGYRHPRLLDLGINLAKRAEAKSLLRRKIRQDKQTLAELEEIEASSRSPSPAGVAALENLPFGLISTHDVAGLRGTLVTAPHRPAKPARNETASHRPPVLAPVFKYEQARALPQFTPSATGYEQNFFIYHFKKAVTLNGTAYIDWPRGLLQLVHDETLMASLSALMAAHVCEDEAAWKLHFLSWIHDRVRDAGRRVDTRSDEFNAMKPRVGETGATFLNRFQTKGLEAGNDIDSSAMDSSAYMARLPEAGQRLMRKFQASQDLVVMRLAAGTRAAWLLTPKSQILADLVAHMSYEEQHEGFVLVPSNRRGHSGSENVCAAVYPTCLEFEDIHVKYDSEPEFAPPFSYTALMR